MRSKTISINADAGMRKTMKNQNPNTPYITSESPGPAGSWHIIREYNPDHAFDELMRNVIRRHLELARKEPRLGQKTKNKEAEPL